MRRLCLGGCYGSTLHELQLQVLQQVLQVWRLRELKTHCRGPIMMCTTEAPALQAKVLMRKRILFFLDGLTVDLCL